MMDVGCAVDLLLGFVGYLVVCTPPCVTGCVRDCVGSLLTTHWRWGKPRWRRQGRTTPCQGCRRVRCTRSEESTPAVVRKAESAAGVASAVRSSRSTLCRMGFFDVPCVR